MVVSLLYPIDISTDTVQLRVRMYEDKRLNSRVEANVSVFSY